MAPVDARASNCNGWQTGLVPLTALGADFYQGYQGGLYPDGANLRPPAHDAAGSAIANAIAPIDTFGNVAPNGQIVFISIGMSNCTQEFSTFVPAANADPWRDPAVQVIDCAAGGQTASAGRRILGHGAIAVARAARRRRRFKSRGSRKPTPDRRRDSRPPPRPS